MSSGNCSSPINISSIDPSIKECNIYCTYYYDYNDSACVVSTDPSGNYLDIKYDLKIVEQVLRLFSMVKITTYLLCEFISLHYIHMIVNMHRWSCLFIMMAVSQINL